jgi:hypothetical protein
MKYLPGGIFHRIMLDFQMNYYGKINWLSRNTNSTRAIRKATSIWPFYCQP